jgi:hypothetical protein
MVGANRQTAPRALVSAASKRAASAGRVGENVAAKPVALGRTTAGAHSKISFSNLPSVSPLTHFEERLPSGAVGSISELNAGVTLLSKAAPDTYVVKEPYEGMLSLGTAVVLRCLSVE